MSSEQPQEKTPKTELELAQEKLVKLQMEMQNNLIQLNNQIPMPSRDSGWSEQFHALAQHIIRLQIEGAVTKSIVLQHMFLLQFIAGQFSETGQLNLVTEMIKNLEQGLQTLKNKAAERSSGIQIAKEVPKILHA